MSNAASTTLGDLQRFPVEAQVKWRQVMSHRKPTWAILIAAGERVIIRDDMTGSIAFLAMYN